jgi:acetyl-CoA carboxylase biotin carboxylase subunit
MPTVPGIPSFRRILIANRGEVALRIARTCDRLGIEPVFAASTADATAPYLRGRTTVILGPAKASESYLDPLRLVQAARQSGCTALHPGWGFLAENARFAQLCEQHGITFIGPSPAAMDLMGRKTPAKRVAAAAGLRLIPGSDGTLRDAAHARSVADEVGYPVLLKAESGGGGRGMRIVRHPDEIATAFASAEAEARAAFGDPRLFLERLIEGGRHVEIQVLADRYGHVVHLGERDCTVQRNHQKLIEESPARAVPADELARTFAAATRVCQDIGYVGAGTIEFLLDHEKKLRFMEMNTRLQVEHCVSEMRTGIDLVEEQIKVAAGHRLSRTQADIEFSGHAIECRINAEDPSQNFRPSPGVIRRFSVPKSPAIRVDTHVEDGYEVPPFYDSLICKIIAHGSTREEARLNMVRALQSSVCEGVVTTIAMHLQILNSAAFIANDYDTRAIPGFETQTPAKG